MSARAKSVLPAPGAPVISMLWSITYCYQKNHRFWQYHHHLSIFSHLAFLRLLSCSVELEPNRLNLIVL